MGRFLLYGKKVGQASHRCLLGCLLRPCQDLNTLVQQKWQETPERQTGTARHCRALRRQPQVQSGTGQRISPGPVFWLQGHLPLPAPSPYCSKLSPHPLDYTSPPSTPKIAKVTFAELQAPKKLCLFQTSQGQQTRESQSVLSQLMQLIRIVLNSESK